MQDNTARCSWATTELLIDYLDTEYGSLASSDNAIYEKICLESFSAGLSWQIVLQMQDALRTAFNGFDIGYCASLSVEATADALSNTDLVRGRRKMAAARNNAVACQGIVYERGVRQFGPVCASGLPKSLGMVPARAPGCSRSVHILPQASAAAGSFRGH